MRHFVKYILLFAFAVLGFSGSGQEPYAEAAHTLSGTDAGDKKPDRLSANEAYKFAGLQRAEERVNIAHNPFYPHSKNNTGDALLHDYVLELRVQNLVSQHVERSRLISPSLTIRDIIFPSHYFW